MIRRYCEEFVSRVRARRTPCERRMKRSTVDLHYAARVIFPKLGLKNAEQSTRVPEQRTCFWYCPAIAEARPQTQNTDEENDGFIRIRQDAT